MLQMKQLDEATLLSVIYKKSHNPHRTLKEAEQLSGYWRLYREGIINLKVVFWK